MSNKLEQLKSKLERLLGFRNMQEKLEKSSFNDDVCIEMYSFSRGEEGRLPSCHP
jgi:hypothetical protein